MKVKILLLSLSLTTLAQSLDLSSLKMVQIVFRHGDRFPIWTYPNDPHKHEPLFYKRNMGQLSDVGKRQHYALGRFLRRRYDGFISKVYSPSETYMVSSDMDRTIMSAQMNLAGLYEPLNLTLNWNSSIDWTPVPIRTIPKEDDNLLGMHKSCPQIHHVSNAIEQLSFYKSTVAEHRHFLDELKLHSGWKEEMTLGGAAMIQDTILIEKLRNYALPAWAEGKLDMLTKLSALDMMFRTYSDEAKRLRAGPLLKEILEGMERSSKKMLLYSGHDSTLGRVLGILGIFNLLPPPFASALIFELHKGPTGDFVQILYRNESEREPFPLEVPGCEHPCQLETLLDITRHLIPEDWESECLLRNSVERSPVLPVFIVMGALMASVLTLAIAILCSNQRQEARRRFLRKFPKAYEAI